MEHSRKAGGFEASRLGEQSRDNQDSPHRACLDESDHWQCLRNDCDGEGLKDQWMCAQQQARGRRVRLTGRRSPKGKWLFGVETRKACFERADLSSYHAHSIHAKMPAIHMSSRTLSLVSSNLRLTAVLRLLSVVQFKMEIVSSCPESSWTHGCS